MVRREILAFTAAERFVHWLHTSAFLVLLLTGLVLYLPQLSVFAAGDAGQAFRLLHRIGAVAMALVPLIYIVTDPWGLINSMGEIFSWSVTDLDWLKAAPRYYFLTDEEAMPPQGRFNTGQKLFYVVVIITNLFLGVTGAIMWFDKSTAPSPLFQWSVILHDLSMILLTGMFMMHFMLAGIHPMMEGAIGGMISGWIPEEYVQSHHRRWYEEIVKVTPVKAEEAEETEEVDHS